MGSPAKVDRSVVRDVPRVDPPAPAGEDSRLTQAQIVTAARELLEECGLEGFSIRRVSARLGVAVGSPYYHVENKAALLRLVAIDIFSSIEPTGPEDGDWAEQWRIWLLRCREVWKRYPDIAAYALQRKEEFEPLRYAEFVHGLLLDAGFSDEASRRAEMVMFFYAAGVLATESAMAGRRVAEENLLADRFVDGLDTLLRGLRLELESGKKARRGFRLRR